jgi:TPP-dependent pyruvate/acetoin dehydrogenase alpha subunit
MSARDPVAIGRRRLAEAGVEDGWTETTDAEVKAANAAALEAALAAPLPDAATLLADVYTEGGLRHG